MIKITVELWPHGREDAAEILATAEIWNDGTGSPFLGSYGYRLRGSAGQVLYRGHLGEYWRKKYGVWWLIASILKSVFPDVEKTYRDRTIRHRAVEE